MKKETISEIKKCAIILLVSGIISTIIMLIIAQPLFLNNKKYYEPNNTKDANGEEMMVPEVNQDR